MPQFRKMMKTTLGFLLLSLMLLRSTATAAGTSAPVPTEFITTESARALQQTDQPPLIIDVRDRRAFAVLHISGEV